MKITLSQMISISCRLSIAVIFGYAVFSKFRGDDIGFYIFESLGIPETRLAIAVIEALAVLLILTPRWVAYGALLSFGTMIGAAIAHITVLGWSIQGDGGELSLLMIAVIICSSLIMYIHRKELPLVGSILD